jgi:hypothetical protein
MPGGVGQTRFTNSGSPAMCGTMKAMNATENTSHDVRPMWVSTWNQRRR